MPIPIIIMLSVIGASIPPLVYFILRWNAKVKPDRTIPGTDIGVKYWADFEKLPADPDFKIEGIDDLIYAAQEVITAKVGKEASERIFDFDIWVFPFSASALSHQTISRFREDGTPIARYSGTTAQYGRWASLVKKRAVRIRDLKRGDVSTTALAHEIAWHLVPRETMNKDWNWFHKINMKELQDAIRAAYKKRIEDA